MPCRSSPRVPAKALQKKYYILHFLSRALLARDFLFKGKIMPSAPDIIQMQLADIPPCGGGLIRSDVSTASCGYRG